MSVAILDSTLTQVAVIDDYQSLMYTRSWHDAGSFQFIINSNLLQSEYVVRGNFILVDNNYRKIGIITETEKTVGRNGKIDEVIKAKGYEAKHILSRRIVIPPAGSDRYQYTDDVETIMKNVVSSQIVSATDSNRNDSLITVSASAGTGPTIQISSRYKNLLEELQGLSLSTGCGYFMEFIPSTKKLNFDISLGVDRTAGQTTNARVIFSSAYDTIKEATITESEISYKNLAYIGGQGEGKDRTIRTVYDGTLPTGIARREYFIDARDLSSTTDLDARAADSLEANSFSMFIDAQALEYGQFKYETDYNLGDIVTIQELNTSQDVRITSVTESWAAGAYDIQLTFDRSFPELNKQVTNNFSSINEILRSSEVSTMPAVLQGNTGFSDPANVTVTYDSATRKITLTGTVDAYWQDKKIPQLISGWVSDAHPNTVGNVYFLSYDGTNFNWSTDTWAFYQLQIAVVVYNTSEKFGVRECHGLMTWQAHKEFHEALGTYRSSGGTMSGFALSSTTAANRRPAVAAAVINDEDLATTNASLAAGTYTQLYLAGAGATATFTTGAGDVVPLSAANPYYNLNTAGTWSQALMTANSAMSIWLFAVPTTSDTGSQAYRYLWLQGQWQTLAAGAAAAQITAAVNAELQRSVSELSLGTFANLSPEYVCIGRIVIDYTGGNWTLRSVALVTGTKVSPVTTVAGNYLSAVNAPFTPGGVLYADASGNVDETQANFSWDDTNKRLTITSASGETIELPQTATDLARFSRTVDGAVGIVVRNLNTGSNAVGAITIVTSDNAGTATSSLAINKYKNGQTVLANSETNAAGTMEFYTAGALRIRINASAGVRVLDNDFANGQLELGSGSTGNRFAYIDFHGDDTYTDYGLRIIRNNTGANASSLVVHRGTGLLGIQTIEDAFINFYTTSVYRGGFSGNGFWAVTTGANVASATTITPTAPQFHVTGTTAIVTINAPYAGFNGAITIIPDGIFTWTAAGNIALAGTAVVSKALIMTYDNNTSKWYPSYT